MVVENEGGGRTTLTYLILGALASALGYFFIVFSKTTGTELLLLGNTDTIDILGGFCIIAGITIIATQLPKIPSHILSQKRQQKIQLEQTLDTEARELDKKQGL
ncbi:MAG: hypothetical protein GF334_09045 [Candidatus Altiarchaeales archaeon]|nr:hypothetical protein [Candidatus Altiarchaeales archaeon]